jgi:hypothetical protein
MRTRSKSSTRTRRLAVIALAAGALFACASPAVAAPQWLAGDFHVHTCFSHDVYCGPGDDNTGPDELYTAGLPVSLRFAEASLRGLDFLAITDHNDVRSVTDPGFGGFGVFGVPGYENSLHGHAQMIGATQVYPKGDGSAADVNSQAAALRADGGVFQINHPVASAGSVTDCDPPGLDWGYGYDVTPDTLEVWNLATPGLDDSTKWWECWLDRGVKLPATGGSDSHWISTLAVQGVANPTTWVLADQPTAAGVLDALRAGRTSVTRLAPSAGSTPLVLEADRDGDGAYEPATGGEVAPGTPMRVTGGGAAGGLLRVRANDATLLDDAQLTPGGAVSFDAPDAEGWIRAELRFLPADAEDAAGCESIPDFGFVPCAGDQPMAAIASPVYVKEPPGDGGDGDGDGGDNDGGGSPSGGGTSGTPGTSASSPATTISIRPGKQRCRTKHRRRCHRRRHT